MPHAAHFLERLDRVPRSLTDFALGLYRDPERVRWIIHYARLPATEERVAFALGPRGDGPYIVLTREGHFVTALGAEMTPKDLTILSRAQVDTFSDRVRDARLRFELAKEIVPPGREPEDVLKLLETRAWAITREELTAIAAWVPILAGRFIGELYEGLEELDEFRRTYLAYRGRDYRNDPAVKATLFKTWSSTFAVGSRLVLSAMGDLVAAEQMAKGWTVPIGPTFPATNERIHSIAMRGAWAIARMGRPFVPAYKRILASSGESMARFDAAIAMTAIGVRHARYRDDARRFVAAMAETPNPPEGDFVHTIVAASQRALDDPEEATRTAALYGAVRVVDQAEFLPDGSPYKFTREDDVPRELALLVAANGIQDSLNRVAFDSLPWVASRASAEELYYPEEMARAFGAQWTPELIEQIYARQLGARREPVVRQAARVGRNDMCTCGSGKKFKKCCGR